MRARRECKISIRAVWSDGFEWTVESKPGVIADPAALIILLRKYTDQIAEIESRREQQETK